MGQVLKWDPLSADGGRVTTGTVRFDSSPLLDGPWRGAITLFIMLALLAMTTDGVLTWLAAEDAAPAVETVEDRDGPIDDRGLILNIDQRAEIASQTDGGRLDRDLVDRKLWLAVVAIIAATALTIAAEPGSSRNVLAIMVVAAAASFFVPLVVYADTIDIVTTSHGG